MPSYELPEPKITRSQAERLADGGPRYKETPADPFAPGNRFPAEPWNTVTAALFIGIVIYWAWRIWSRWRQFPFIACCLPILLAGGIGGTLYHAKRTQLAYFLLDLIPILLLGTLGSIYLTIRLARELGVWRVALVASVALALFVFLNGVLFRQIDFPNPNWRVNFSYGSQAVLLLMPIGVMLVRTGFRHGSWVLIALICFAQAWFCRLVDNTGWDALPMGTHWLWHLLGAATTQALIVYFYRIEAEPVRPVAANTPSGAADSLS